MNYGEGQGKSLFAPGEKSLPRGGKGDRVDSSPALKPIRTPRLTHEAAYARQADGCLARWLGEVHRADGCSR